MGFLAMSVGSVTEPAACYRDDPLPARYIVYTLGKRAQNVPSASLIADAMVEKTLISAYMGGLIGF